MKCTTGGPPGSVIASPGSAVCVITISSDVTVMLRPSKGPSEPASVARRCQWESVPESKRSVDADAPPASDKVLIGEPALALPVKLVLIEVLSAASADGLWEERLFGRALAMGLECWEVELGALAEGWVWWPRAIMRWILTWLDL